VKAMDWSVKRVDSSRVPGVPKKPRRQQGDEKPFDLEALADEEPAEPEEEEGVRDEKDRSVSPPEEGEAGSTLDVTA